jgi:hypothetical protein
MAVSTCLKCAGHSFELVMFTPMGESHKLKIVQCSNCGTPIVGYWTLPPDLCWTP